MTEQIKMHIFVKNSLRKGRAISQACHVTQKVTEEAIRMGYESIGKLPDTYITYMKWRNNCIKIVHKVSSEQLEELAKRNAATSFVDDNELTAVAFFPGGVDETIAAQYPLF